MNRRLGGDASLNAPLREEGEGEWQDWLVDDSASQESLLADREESDARIGALQNALRVLNPRERRIFEARRLADDPDHAGGAVDRVRRLARARAPDRGARVREGAGGGEGGGGARAAAAGGPRRRAALPRRAGPADSQTVRGRAGAPPPAQRELGDFMTFSKQARLCAWLGATALAYPALAADRPADPAGARAIADFIADYAGKATAPSVKVVSEGSSYLVTLDLGALNATLKPTGFTYDAAELKFRVFQQDDGQWRIETASTPPISGRMTPPNGQGTLESGSRPRTLRTDDAASIPSSAGSPRATAAPTRSS